MYFLSHRGSMQCCYGMVLAIGLLLVSHAVANTVDSASVTLRVTVQPSNACNPFDCQPYAEHNPNGMHNCRDYGLFNTITIFTPKCPLSCTPCAGPPPEKTDFLRK